MHQNQQRQWTPVALSADLRPASVVPAWTPMGQIALWRSASGTLSASADRCPHRGMRLSHGFVRGEILSCIYHGWSYGQTGQCVRIPAHPDLTPPDTIRVETYTAQEANGVIWVAQGAEQTAPPTLDGVDALRSMGVAASPEAIERAADAQVADDGVLATSLAGTDVTILLVPQDPAQTLIHLLVDKGAETSARIAVSRAAEVLRRSAEALDLEGATS